MFKLGKWNFRCRFSRDEWTRDNGWYYFNIGAFWLHRLPPEGDRLCRNDYYGFNWTIYFFLPVVFQRLPVRKVPNEKPQKTLVWCGKYQIAKEFLKTHRIENGKVITSSEQLRGLRDATLIDLGLHDLTDSTNRMYDAIEYHTSFDRLKVLSAQEYLAMKEKP